MLPTSGKPKDGSTLELMNTQNQINLPANLLVIECTSGGVDLIFGNSCIIDRSNGWCLLLFKEACRIRRCHPLLKHGACASKAVICT